MSQSKKAAAAERIAIAKERGRALVSRMEATDKLSVDQLAALADDFEALFTEYADVYPTPPVSVEVLRAHVNELRVADEAARVAQAEHEEAQRNLEEAQRGFSAALNVIGAPRAKPVKPS